MPNLMISSNQPKRPSLILDHPFNNHEHVAFDIYQLLSFSPSEKKWMRNNNQSEYTRTYLIWDALFGLKTLMEFHMGCSDMFRPTKDNAALKARLRRLCEPKKGGRLQVPQWLHDMWKSGDHLKLAQEFQSCNFNKETIEKMFGFKMFSVLTTIPRIETLAYSSTSPTSSPLSKLLFWIQSAPVLAGSVHSVQDQNPDQERDECECHL